MKNDKKIGVSIVKGKIKDEHLEEVNCDGKSIFNIAMLLFFMGLDLLCFWLNSEWFFKGFSWNISGIIDFLGLFLLILSPVIYFALKIVNVKFTINKERVSYQTILGKKYSYPLEDIVKTKIYPGAGDDLTDTIVITFKNKRRVKVNSTSRNFEKLKNFVVFNEDCKLSD